MNRYRGRVLFLIYLFHKHVIHIYGHVCYKVELTQMWLIYFCPHTHTHMHSFEAYARINTKISFVKLYCYMQQKLKAIQLYVAELSQQHEMLIETMDQMEKEANKKLSFLEGRLTTSLQTTKVKKEILTYYSYKIHLFHLGISEQVSSP